MNSSDAEFQGVARPVARGSSAAAMAPTSAPLLAPHRKPRWTPTDQQKGILETAAQAAVAVSRYLSDSRAQSSTHHTSGISRFLSFGYSAPNFSKFHAWVARARVPIPIQLKAAKAAGASEPHAMP